MRRAPSTPVVHLELHTGDRAGAADLYADLLGWRPEQIRTRHGSYTSVELASRLGGGIVECPTSRAVWLPYVEVADVSGATERARALGGRVLLEPREGPAGWRSVVSTPVGGEIAFWEHKR